jgi:flagellin
MDFSSQSGLQMVFALQRELIGQLVESGDTQALADKLLKPRLKSGREIAAEALTGLMRSDAALFRQAKNNALEGRSIADTLHSTMQGISAALETMKDIAARYDSVSPDAADRAAYEEARRTISDLVGNAEYNGISLMDGTKWGNDSRLKVENGEASLNVRMGKTDKSLLLTDMNQFFSALPAFHELGTAGAPGELDAALKTATMYEAGYKGLSASFQSSAKALGVQADIDDDAAARSILGAREDVEGRLLYYLLTEHGKILRRES